MEIADRYQYGAGFLLSHGIGGIRTTCQQHRGGQAAGLPGLQAVELRNKLYVIAGRSPKNTDIPRDSLIHGDVWVSHDLGVNWVELLEDAEEAGLWRNRAYFEAVTQGNHMYILGGQNFVAIPRPFPCAIWPPQLGPCPEFITASDFFNDVWRSTDGVNWKEMTSDAPWEARAGLSAASFKGRLWVMAGSQNDDASIGGLDRKFFNDVWYSRDGSKWHAATREAPWEARAGAVALGDVTAELQTQTPEVRLAS